ncbi:MAG TPA: hypothetical protein VNK94_11335 [Gaiellaceae bacterium]|nr:hypothetical protein [Gaiellaceae bacterium]
MTTAQEISFSVDDYRLDVPECDGLRAQRIALRFSGACELDRTSTDDLAFLAALRLGAPVRLIVTGTASGKGFSLRPEKAVPGDLADVAYSVSVRVEAVELGELA